MIKEYHGKRYYIVFKDLEECGRINDLIISEEALKNEKFYVTKHPDGRWIVFSESPTGAFRGDKYSAWERVKRKLYTLRRKDS